MKTLFISLILSSFAFATPVEDNKKLVRDFYDLAFKQHKPTEAAKKYLGSQYIQHNPHVPNGAPAFYGFFEGYFKGHPQARVEIKHVLGDGDLVMLHLLAKSDDKDRGIAVVDIFRVEKGKIVEHWDVQQAVPEQSANSNTMF